MKDRESECNKLRKTIHERNAEMDRLREQMHELMSQSPLPDDQAGYTPTQDASNYEYQSSASTYPFFPIQTTNRNYFFVPSPVPQFAFQGQEAFKEKIDYSKIQLRKIEDSYLDGSFTSVQFPPPIFLLIFFSIFRGKTRSDIVRSSLGLQTKTIGIY